MVALNIILGVILFLVWVSCAIFVFFCVVMASEYISTAIDYKDRNAWIKGIATTIVALISAALTAWWGVVVAVG